jgi:hypothetical protein
MIMEEKNGKNKHDKGADDPVLHERQAEHFWIIENQGQFFVFYLGKGRVHHHYQTNSDWDIGCTTTE